jgi:hypothetical protein
MSSYQRHVELAAFNDDQGAGMRAALEDDFHHFRVILRHAEGKVTAVQGVALRYPYSACPQATDQLRQLVGMPLSDVAHSVIRQADAEHQCTHLLDLAGLAIAACAQQCQRRSYVIEVPDRQAGLTCPSIERDDGLIVRWEVQDDVITAPPRYAGVNLREGMARWALASLSVEEAEAALLLRRCTLISMGRAYRLDDQLHASSTGRCYSQQPERAANAFRIKGSTWDFSERRVPPGDADRTWVVG